MEAESPGHGGDHAIRCLQVYDDGRLVSFIGAFDNDDILDSVLLAGKGPDGFSGKVQTDALRGYLGARIAPVQQSNAHHADQGTKQKSLHITSPSGVPDMTHVSPRVVCPPCVQDMSAVYPGRGFITMGIHGRVSFYATLRQGVTGRSRVFLGRMQQIEHGADGLGSDMPVLWAW